MIITGGTFIRVATLWHPWIGFTAAVHSERHGKKGHVKGRGL